MKTIKKIVKAKEDLLERGIFELSFAEFYYEHNGRKFRVHYEATSSSPCASIGMDWYQSLSIMTQDGTWKQVADAKIVGAVTHYTLDNRYLGEAKVMRLLNDADEKFRNYIEEIWS